MRPARPSATTQNRSRERHPRNRSGACKFQKGNLKVRVCCIHKLQMLTADKALRTPKDDDSEFFTSVSCEVWLDGLLRSGAMQTLLFQCRILLPAAHGYFEAWGGGG